MPEFKLGRLAPLPEEQAPRLRLGRFLTPDAFTLPPTPPLVDWISRVQDWPMYLNDQIGCCTISGAGHMIEAWSQYGEGHTVEVTDADVLAAYEAVSGYNPGDPATDRGAVMQLVLQYWRSTGVGTHKILAFAQVDHGNLDEVKAALNLFGHVYVGVNLPLSAMDQFRAGEPWDVVPADGGILGGHCVDLGYDAAGGLTVITWGKPQPVTQAWWEAYTEEAWAVVSGDWLDVAGHSPAGLDLQALGEAFAALTGEPDPFPAPPSPPAPPAADAADRALATAAHPWVSQHHVGAAEHMADALRTWLSAKGL